MDMSRSDVRREILETARGLWPLIHKAKLGTRQPFNPYLLALSAALSRLAYCSVDRAEHVRIGRAKVVPCELYQRVIRYRFNDAELQQILREADFQNTQIIRTETHVALIVPVFNHVFVAVRGTQGAYDWGVNFSAARWLVAPEIGIHRGFANETIKLANALRQSTNGLLFGPSVYFTGHSLGGAVASLLGQFLSGCSPLDIYVFGAPRVAKTPHELSHRPRAVRRPLDIVPHVPPAILSYRDFSEQISASGHAYSDPGRIETLVFLSWLTSLAIGNFLANHSMEQYYREARGHLPP